MRGFPIEYWKREIRRRADDMLLMVKEKKQFFLKLEGSALDPEDARRKWSVMENYAPVVPRWLRSIIDFHSCLGCQESHVAYILIKLDRMEAFLFEWLETNHPGDRGALSRAFDRELSGEP